MLSIPLSCPPCVVMDPGCGLLVESFFGYSRLVVWAVPVLIATMAFQGVWAWYVTRRQLTATTVARQRRLLGQIVAVSAGIGVAILAAGVVGFVLAGYNWLVLALTWAFGLLHLGLLVRTRRLGRRTQPLGKP
jgi:hypothetical protein